ncbi:MAG: putative signal peptide protein, partial [Pseudomonadota bacterium]
NLASLSHGQFVKRRVFQRPSGMPNLNNEGITFAPESECAAGVRAFFWSDDSPSNGHALRRGGIPCGRAY